MVILDTCVVGNGRQMVMRNSCCGQCSCIKYVHTLIFSAVSTMKLKHSSSKHRVNIWSFSRRPRTPGWVRILNCQYNNLSNNFTLYVTSLVHIHVGVESGPDQDMVSQMLEEALGSDEQSVTKERSK